MSGFTPTFTQQVKHYKRWRLPRTDLPLSLPKAHSKVQKSKGFFTILNDINRI